MQLRGLVKTKEKDEFILTMNRNTISIPNGKLRFKGKTKRRRGLGSV